MIFKWAMIAMVYIGALMSCAVASSKFCPQNSKWDNLVSGIVWPMHVGMRVGAWAVTGNSTGENICLSQEEGSWLGKKFASTAAAYRTGGVVTNGM
jgi:hypothetical protein